MQSEAKTVHFLRAEGGVRIRVSKIEIALEDVEPPSIEQWLPVYRARCERLVDEAVRGAGGVSVLLCGEEGIRRLNRAYRGCDRVTDVLSFPQHSSGYDFSPAGAETGNGGGGVLGDIAISIPVAAGAARRYGVSVGDEVLRLTIHGVLHLLGFCHGDSESGHDSDCMLLTEDYIWQALRGDEA